MSEQLQISLVVLIVFVGYVFAKVRAYSASQAGTYQLSVE